MTETKAVTDFGAVVQAEERYEKASAMNIFKEMMNKIEDERLNVANSKFQIGGGVVHINVTLIDDKGHKQSDHKEVVEGAIKSILEHTGYGSKVYYETDRIEVDDGEDVEEEVLGDSNGEVVEATEASPESEDEDGGE